ncbi:MAG: PilZ domain-containing protein [Candidatus Thiodiazotropha sp.]
MTLDARRSPRRKTSLPVTLSSKAGGAGQACIIKDLSESGLFITCPTSAKIDGNYQLSIKRPGAGEYLELSARVIRVDNWGSALIFDRLEPQKSRLLSNLIQPKWDGKDLLEGVIMHGMLEDTANFAACMRLTSLLSSNYRHTNRAL